MHNISCACESTILESHDYLKTGKRQQLTTTHRITNIVQTRSIYVISSHLHWQIVSNDTNVIKKYKIGKLNGRFIVIQLRPSL